jgi:hypothetical protein
VIALLDRSGRGDVSVQGEKKGGERRKERKRTLYRRFVDGFE